MIFDCDILKGLPPGDLDEPDIITGAKAEIIGAKVSFFPHIYCILKANTPFLNVKICPVQQ